MKTEKEKQEFYTKCGELLNIDHEYHIPWPQRNRWNTRTLGNGRYIGFGTIQIFGSQVRVMSKKGTKMFNTFEEVYDFLQTTQS